MEASCSTLLERTAAMCEPDFWTQCAEAMEQQIEGRRLIAAEVADLARQMWHDATRKLDGLIHGSHQQRPVPPL